MNRLKSKKLKLTFKINKVCDKFNLEEDEDKRDELFDELGDLINEREKLNRYDKQI